MAQQMRNHDFDRPPAVVSDRRKRKHEKAAHVGGFFYSGLSVELQESLVEYRGMQQRLHARLGERR